jgi:hypothetical protein
MTAFASLCFYYAYTPPCGALWLLLQNAGLDRDGKRHNVQQ